MKIINNIYKKIKNIIEFYKTRFYLKNNVLNFMKMNLDSILLTFQNYNNLFNFYVTVKDDIILFENEQTNIKISLNKGRYFVYDLMVIFSINFLIMSFNFNFFEKLLRNYHKQSYSLVINGEKSELTPFQHLGIMFEHKAKYNYNYSQISYNYSIFKLFYETNRLDNGIVNDETEYNGFTFKNFFKPIPFTKELYPFDIFKNQNIFEQFSFMLMNNSLLSKTNINELYNNIIDAYFSHYYPCKLFYFHLYQDHQFLNYFIENALEKYYLNLDDIYNRYDRIYFFSCNDLILQEINGVNEYFKDINEVKVFYNHYFLKNTISTNNIIKESANKIKKL